MNKTHGVATHVIDVDLRAGTERVEDYDEEKFQRWIEGEFHGEPVLVPNPREYPKKDEDEGCYHHWRKDDELWVCIFCGEERDEEPTPIGKRAFEELEKEQVMRGFDGGGPKVDDYGACPRTLDREHAWREKKHGVVLFTYCVACGRRKRDV